jgi:hypothetical protein
VQGRQRRERRARNTPRGRVGGSEGPITLCTLTWALEQLQASIALVVHGRETHSVIDEMLFTMRCSR